jgi:glutaredoxin 2
MSQAVTTKTPAELVEAYIKLRDKKEAAQDEFKKSLETTNQVMDMLEAVLLQKLQELGVDSLTAKGIGTVYRNTTDSATVEDKDAFRKYLESTGDYSVLDLKANKKVARELANAGTPIPGVKFTSIHSVGIRRK